MYPSTQSPLAGLRDAWRLTRSSWVLPLALLAIAATVAFALTGDDPVTSDGTWQVVASSRTGLTVRIATTVPEWRRSDGPVRDVAYDVPHLPGFAPSGEPGTPAVPRAGRWIVVPDGMRPVVVPGRVEWQPLVGRRLPPVLVPVVEGRDETARIHEEMLWRGEAPRRGRIALPADEWGKAASAPPAGLVVGTPVRWRDRLVAPVTCVPLEVTADGHTRRRLVQGEWTIRFEPDPRGTRARVGRAAGRGDDRFAGLFLNGGMLTMDRPVPTTQPSVRQAEKRGSLLAPEVRLPVGRTGFQRVTARQLIDSGLLPTGIEERQLRLYQRRMPTTDPLDTGDYVEVEVPILVEGDGGEFAGDDAIVFYGLRPRDDRAFQDGGFFLPDCGDTNETYNPVATDPVNGGNIYYLAASEPPAGEAWARMEAATLPPAGGTGPSWYLRSDYHEQDLYYAEAPSGETVDRNHWNSRFASAVEVALDPVNPAAAGPHPWLEIGMFGYGTDQREVTLALVGPADTLALGTLAVSPSDPTPIGTVFADSILSLTAPELADRRLLVTRSPLLMCYLDWFRLVYPSLYRAHDNVLLFHAGDGVGSIPLRVGGFTGGPLALFDISDPRHPRWVDLQADNVVDEGDGTLTLSLQVEQSSPRAWRFQAFGESLDLALPTYPIFQASRVDEDTDPLQAGTPPDVVVVAHPMFLEQARQWATWRSEHFPGGLEIHVVDVHSLYDRFSGGLKNPIALKRFCQYALDNWGTWALQIFGDASENVRQLHDAYDLVDLVPSHWHVWRLVNYTNEVLPSDEWFVNPDAGPDYPYDTASLPSMVVGRFPAGSVDELQAMLDKLMVFAAADDGPEWKRRALFIADDAWSAGYDIAGTDQNYFSSEEAFQASEAAFAEAWAGFLGPGAPQSGLVADSLFVATYLDPLSPPHDQARNRLQFQDYAEQYVLPDLLAKLNAGAMMVRYQGHANNHLLAHEQILEDVEGYSYRQDVASLDNGGRPFLFFGLGCHIGAYALGNSENRLRVSKSLAEKMLSREAAGACGTYASPGYEFLSPNETLSNVFRTTMLFSPPTGPDGITRWVLGDLVLAGEMAFLAQAPQSSTYRRAVAQYAVLGDALTVLDAGPPLVSVAGTDGPLDDGDDLTAPDGDNLAVLTVDAYDEAGIAGIAVTTSDGTDLTDRVTGGRAPGATTDQHHRYTLSLPVAPYDHDIVIQVFDSADEGDQGTHFRFTLHVPVRVVLTSDGQPFDPETDPLRTGERRSFQGSVTTGTYLTEDTVIELHGLFVTLQDVSLVRTGPHALDVTFTAEATGLGTPAVELTIDGAVTHIPLAEEPTVAGVTIADLQAFPNPCRDRVRFLLTTSLASGEGWIDLYSLAGRHVARVPVTPADFVGGGRVIVPWDGRDGRGDRLANGVYLYRATLNGSGGTASSGMQRLVVMH